MTFKHWKLFFSEPHMSGPWGLLILALQFSLSLAELRFWPSCYLCGLWVKHICLLLRFSDTRYVITFSSSSCPPAWCVCLWFLMPCHVSMPLSRAISDWTGLSPAWQACLAELLAAVCEDWMLHFLFPRGQWVLQEAFNLSQSFALHMLCVCVYASFLILVTSLLRREDNAAHYSAQGPTEWLIFL